MYVLEGVRLTEARLVCGCRHEARKEERRGERKDKKEKVGFEGRARVRAIGTETL